MTPADLRTLADLARFPFTTKEDLRQNYPFGMFAVPRGEVSRVHASSGTTGKPTVVGYTRDDLEVWAEVMARSIYAAGGRPGDLVHVAYGYGLFTGGLGAHYGAERLGCTVVPVSGGMTPRQVQLIVDFEPRVIMVTPSYFLAILDEMEAQGVDPRATSLEIGIFGAEPWTDEMRHEVERRSDIKAVDIYGLSEVMGPGVSQEAVATQDGLHVWEDHFYPEVIDPVTGEVLPDGEEGELVFTSLTKQAMPVVRYRTRDLTRLLPGTAYPAFRRMQKVTGRTDDMMIVRGVNVFPTHGRGADPQGRGTHPALPVRAHPAGHPGRAHRPGRGARVGRRGRPGGARPPAGRARQGQRRHDGPRRGARPARAGALAGQGEADLRPALTPWPLLPPFGAARGPQRIGSEGPRRQGRVCMLRSLVVLLTTALLAGGPARRDVGRLTAAATEPATPVSASTTDRHADSVYPSVGDPGVDVLDYGLHLRWEPRTRTLVGVARVRLVPARDGRFRLDLSGRLNVLPARGDRPPDRAAGRVDVAGTPVGTSTSPRRGWSRGRRTTW